MSGLTLHSQRQAIFTPMEMISPCKISTHVPAAPLMPAPRSGCADLGHIPKYGGQLVHPVSVQRGYVQAAYVGPRGPDREYRQHFRPVRGLPLYVNNIIIPGLQQLQAVIIGHIDRTNRLRPYRDPSFPLVWQNAKLISLS